MEHIDLFLYINLEKRSDRDKHMKKLLLDDLKIPPKKVVRIDAIYADPPFRGCTKSHLLALMTVIKAAHCKFICILEDDFTLTTDVLTFQNRVASAWKMLNEDFDVVFLACTPIRLEHTSEKRFFRVKQALAMPGMIVHQRYFEKLKKIYEQALNEKKPHDLITQMYQPKDKWYVFWPPIGCQAPGYSDIEQRVVNYAYLDVQGQMIVDKQKLKY